MSYGYELDYYEAEVVNILPSCKLEISINCGLGFRGDRICELHDLIIPEEIIPQTVAALENLIPPESLIRLKLYTQSLGNISSYFAEVWTIDGRNINQYLINNQLAAEAS